MSKSEIFTEAWELAKAGAIRFGGSSKDFFAASLKIVYAQSRVFVLEVQATSRKPAWCAAVTGLDARFGFKRSFIGGNGHWELADGVYNWGYKGCDNEFLIIKNGKATVASNNTVKLMFA